MIHKIEDMKVITDIEAREKYRDKYIGCITVEQNILDPEQQKIIVLYLADTYEECYEERI